MKLATIAYHSTSPACADVIMQRGFRIPRSVSDAVTDGQVGDFFPCVFFARRPTRDYGDALVKVLIRGDFIKFKPRVRESWAAAQHRLVDEAIVNGKCGVAADLDTVGIMVTDLSCVRVLEKL